jgi:hypothetical protein
VKPIATPAKSNSQTGFPERKSIMTTTINPPAPRSAVRNYGQAMSLQAPPTKREPLKPVEPQRRGRAGSVIRAALLLPILGVGIGMALSGLLPVFLVCLALFLPVILPIFLLTFGAFSDGALAESSVRSPVK